MLRFFIGLLIVGIVNAQCNACLLSPCCTDPTSTCPYDIPAGEAISAAATIYDPVTTKILTTVEPGNSGDSLTLEICNYRDFDIPSQSCTAGLTTGITCMSGFGYSVTYLEQYVLRIRCDNWFYSCTSVKYGFRFDKVTVHQNTSAHIISSTSSYSTTTTTIPSSTSTSVVENGGSTPSPLLNL